MSLLMVLILCICYLLWRETHLYLCVWGLLRMLKRTAKLPCCAKIDSWTESNTLLFCGSPILFHSLFIKRWNILSNLMWLLVFLWLWSFTSRKSHDFLSFISSTARCHFFVDSTYFITVFWKLELVEHLLAFYYELSLAIHHLVIAVWVTLTGTTSLLIFSAKGGLGGALRTWLSKALDYFASHNSKVVFIARQGLLLTIILIATSAAIELVSNLLGG